MPAKVPILDLASDWTITAYPMQNGLTSPIFHQSASFISLLCPGLLPCIPGYNRKFAFHQAHIGISIYRPEWSHHFSRVSCSLSKTYLELFLFDVFSVVAINSLSFVIPGQPRNTTHIKQTLNMFLLLFFSYLFCLEKMCLFGSLDHTVVRFFRIPGSWWHFSSESSF